MTHVTYDDLPPEEDHYAPVTTLHPHANTQAEAALISLIIADPITAPDLLKKVDPEDFYEPRHEIIWTAISAVLSNGILPDHAALLEQLRTQGDATRVHLHDFTITTTGAIASQDLWYADIVRNAAITRRATTALAQAQQKLHAANGPQEVGAALGAAMDSIDHGLQTLWAAGGPTALHVPNIDEILAGEDDDTYDWVIPGLIEHQERVILTAEEGAGKSTLLRQIGITAASGIHPFSGEQIPPVTVLHIDVENSLRQSRRRYRPLRIQAGDALNPDLLRVELKVAGLDLTQTPDRDWLLQITQSIKPDLLLIGPIYKLANGDPTEEKSAKPVAMILDQVRDLTDCALILEAHVAKAPSGQKKRPHEPYGWSGWLRWPELGIFMDKDGTLKHWRGAREEREWPEKLERGGHWPWSAALTGPDEAWIAIQKARKDAKRPVSLRDLEQMTGFSKSTLGRLVGPTGKYAHGWPGYNNSNLISDRRDGS
jgi:hypothetical protein